MTAKRQSNYIGDLSTIQRAIKKTSSLVGLRHSFGQACRDWPVLLWCSLSGYSSRRSLMRVTCMHEMLSSHFTNLQPCWQIERTKRDLALPANLTMLAVIFVCLGLGCQLCLHATALSFREHSRVLGACCVVIEYILWFLEHVLWFVEWAL